MKGSAATVALFFVFVSVPLLGMIPGIFVAAPGIYFALKSGRVVGSSVVAITAALLAGTGDVAAAAIYLLQGGIITLALPEFLIRGKGGARSVVYTAAIDLVALLGAALLYGALTGTDLHAKVLKGIEGSIKQSVLLYQQMGIKGEELTALQQTLQQAAGVILNIYPSLLTVTLGALAALNLLVVAKYVTRLPRPVHLGEFRKYRNPEPLVWLLILAGFGTLVPQPLVHLAALNVLIVLCALYAVQGLAVIVHYFTRFAVPTFIRLMACLIIVLQPFLALAVVALGVFDLWGDFRTPKNKENL
ncbi:YybS family protein [Geomonas sp. RF6]|uniref:YybS family protein n=1 Tax=Geomonas sp. RF6 TaxID=2897342 RepID=UPI001E34D9FD|nr:YybS family protein [Geomonas sp. RF6]UFS68889.1 YybS family protein [Geomonas sp. RF6]